jgi:hypothetical protein
MLAAVALVVAAGCRSRPPETRIVVVTATPAPATIVLLPEPTETPTVQTAEFSFPITEPTERPEPVAPVVEREPEPPTPAPKSVDDQLARCLSFRTERFGGETNMYVAVIAAVRATNICGESFPAQGVWIEVRVFHAAGGKIGLAGRQIARFYGNGPDGRLVTEIPAHGTADVLVLVEGVDQAGLYRYEASLSSPPSPSS